MAARQRRSGPHRGHSAAHAPVGQASLRLPEPPERLAALRREHDGLLRKVAAKRREMQRLQARVEETANVVHGTLHPLVAELRGIERELHALFAELLAPRRLRPAFPPT